MGLPSSVRKVDAAFMWGKNKKTYFFAGDLYWRYNEYERRMEDGYPWEIRLRWKGVPDDLDSVITAKNGEKGKVSFRESGLTILVLHFQA